MIEAQCSCCGTNYRLQDGMAGKNAKCKKCGAVISIPHAAADASVPLGSNKETIKYKCPKCSCELENPGTMGGREDQCPLCGFIHPVPLSKGQQKELKRRKTLEAEAAKQAMIRQRREEEERAQREREKEERAQRQRQLEAVRPLTPETGAPPPLIPPPLADPAKEMNKAGWYLIGGIVLIVAVASIAAAVASKTKSANVDSLKDFALVARQLTTGISEGMTFADLGEKASKLRDGYAVMDRQKVPPSLVRKAETALEQVKELREIWRQHVYEGRSANSERLVELKMGPVERALRSFLSEYDPLTR